MASASTSDFNTSQIDESASVDSSLLTGNNANDINVNSLSNDVSYLQKDNIQSLHCCGLNFEAIKECDIFQLRTAYKYFKGSMPLEQTFVLKHGKILEFIDNCLRGISQIFFVCIHSSDQLSHYKFEVIFIFIRKHCN